VAFIIDHRVRRRQQALLTARIVPYQARPRGAVIVRCSRLSS